MLLNDSREIINDIKGLLYDTILLSFSSDAEPNTTIAGMNSFLIQTQKLVDQLLECYTKQLILDISNNKTKSIDEFFPLINEEKEVKIEAESKPVFDISLENVSTIKDIIKQFTNSKMSLSEYKQTMLKYYLEIIRDEYPTNVKIAKAIGTNPQYIPKLYEKAGVILKPDKSKISIIDNNDNKPLNGDELKTAIENAINDESSMRVNV